MRRRVARLPVTLLAFFFRQLATLVGSGIPLVQAWQLLMADMPGRYRRPLHLAALQMEQGVCPSQAMDQCRAFPELACRLIRAGEQTGNLEGLCRVLADFYETKGKERRLLVQALAYPAFLLVCLILLTAGACLFIIPVFTDMMDQMAVPLPKGTQYLLAAMGALRHYGIYGLAGLTVGLLVLRWAWQQAEWRLELERQFFPPALAPDLGPRLGLAAVQPDPGRPAGRRHPLAGQSARSRCRRAVAPFPAVYPASPAAAGTGLCLQPGRPRRPFRHALCRNHAGRRGNDRQVR